MLLERGGAAARRRAERRPVAALGVAFALGLALSRVLRPSALGAFALAGAEAWVARAARSAVGGALRAGRTG